MCVGDRAAIGAGGGRGERTNESAKTDRRGDRRADEGRRRCGHLWRRRIRTTVLSGDPTKAGPDTIEIRVPAHTEIAAHRHRDDRSAVVVSGTWYFGYGSNADAARTKAMGSGSFYTEPRDMPHFAETRDDAAVVYITGVGPTDTRYVDIVADLRRSPRLLCTQTRTTSMTTPSTLAPIAGARSATDQ